ncbi:MAG: carboxypeptidase-like regulatory domain-containing protein, partial [Elusimicrobiota bacterium]
YVSVRVYDNSANFTVYADVFYVRRDTTPPNIINTAASPPGWLAADPGAVFDVDFNDALSGLGQVLYSASSNPGVADSNVLGWTAVDGFAPGPSHTALWGVNFAALRDGATNYISVRAADAAGNTRTLTDAFKLLKNTVGPAVTITSPAGAYVSTVTDFTGSASAMNEISPVTGNQVSIQELTGNLYYDGSAFASASEVWLGAAGLSSWSYNASTAPFATGVQYKLRARSRDINSFVTPLPYPNASFRLDQVSPSVSLSTPLAGSTVYALNAVEGAAADTGGAGLGEVEIYVKRVADGKWWNFSSDSWGGSPISSAAAAGGAWAFVPGAGLRGGLAHNQQYFITALSKDAALPPNTSVFGAAGSTFTWVDTVPPDAVTAFAPSTGSSPGRVDLAWTFPGDDGGALALTYGQFAVQYSTFAGAVFSTQAAQVIISTAMVRPGSALAYTVAGLTPEATYYFRMWVKDDADFWSGPSALASTSSGDRLNDMIAGSVKTPGGEGITGVMVDAISNSGLVTASAYTLDDGLGSFTLNSLPDGIYRVQATWLEDGFSSSIAKDQIPMGYADANFVLSLDYQ